ncbi:pirin family protein [Asticcacaulis sp. W401b]|uniref:pirin family protein n=1 Tax=Asticcacaulis sp. W401b TaxID=3388666 RepID=UPI00397063C9
MSLLFSPVADAIPAAHGDQFSAKRLDLKRLGKLAYPVMGFDHYRMRGPTFAPHPHAGFSAVSYLFEDSIGGLRNRDSLSNDLVIAPGAMVWTQAGRGVVHDELPAQNGLEVHGVQVFVNLARSNKSIAPAMFHIEAGSVPVVTDETGNVTRVLAGHFDSASSPLVPAEPFDFLDVKLKSSWTYNIPSGRNVLLYILKGKLAVKSDTGVITIREGQALAVQALDPAALALEPEGPTHLLLLSGTDPDEPIAVYGPFIMNDEQQLRAAFERYRQGDMGHLSEM